MGRAGAIAPAHPGVVSSQGKNHKEHKDTGERENCSQNPVEEKRRRKISKFSPFPAFSISPEAVFVFP